MDIWLQPLPIRQKTVEWDANLANQLLLAIPVDAFRVILLIPPLPALNAGHTVPNALKKAVAINAKVASSMYREPIHVRLVPATA